MILFRGQTRRKGETVNMKGEPIPSNWVYGGVFKPNDDTAFALIYSYDDCQKYAVYNDTVGMFSGVKDVKVNNVFEGDIIKCKWNRVGIVKYGVYNQDGSGGEYSPTKCIGWYIHFLGDNWYNSAEQDESILSVQYGFQGKEEDREFEVIGNIYDNPEMIK